MGLPVTTQVTCGIYVPVSQMKRKKGPTYMCGWVTKGSALSLTIQEPFGNDVDIWECLNIATMGSTTIKADQTANQWGASLEGVRSDPPPFWVPLEPQCARVYNA